MYTLTEHSTSILSALYTLSLYRFHRAILHRQIDRDEPMTYVRIDFRLAYNNSQCVFVANFSLVIPLITPILLVIFLKYTPGALSHCIFVPLFRRISSYFGPSLPPHSLSLSLLSPPPLSLPSFPLSLFSSSYPSVSPSIALTSILHHSNHHNPILRCVFCVLHQSILLNHEIALTETICRLVCALPSRFAYRSIEKHFFC